MRRPPSMLHPFFGRSLLVLPPASLLVLAACGGVRGDDPDYIDVGEGGAPGAARQAPASPEDGGRVVDAGGDEEVDVAACPDTGRGPKMVRVQRTGASAFCVDATEVTKLQYQAFVDDAKGNAVVQAAACTWNTTFTPQYDWPPGARGQYPASNIDWCDARAFCDWAGKRLCAEGEWAAACAGPSGRAFPYGDTFEPMTCTGCAAQGICGKLAYNATTPVGARAGCASAPGLFDMSGNVEEWVDACSAGGAPEGNDDLCVTRGGGFPDDGDALACRASVKRRRDAIQGETGLRCCAPLR